MRRVSRLNVGDICATTSFGYLGGFCTDRKGRRCSNKGTNPSACALLAKLDNTLADSLISVVYANVQQEMAERLARFGIDSSKIFKNDGNFASFQCALKYCEDMVLSSSLDAELHPLATPAQQRSQVSDELIPTYIAELAKGLSCSTQQVELGTCGGSALSRLC